MQNKTTCKKCHRAKVKAYAKKNPTKFKYDPEVASEARQEVFDEFRYKINQARDEREKREVCEEYIDTLIYAMPRDIEDTIVRYMEPEVY